MRTPAADFDRAVERLAYRHERWRVFADFCECAAISVTQPFTHSEQREERYLSIASTYSAEEMALFPELLGLVVMGLGDGPSFSDFLGSAFERLGLASHWAGQFFTPPELCNLLGGFVATDAPALVARRGFVTASDPACGSGNTVIGLANALRAAGVEPQERLHACCVDVAPVCVYMATVQLSLLHIPAEIWLGDSLRLEYRERWLTPAHVLGFWDSRLARARETPHTAQPLPAGQLALLFDATEAEPPTCDAS